MEESRFSRRKGLAILGAAAGSALLGTSLAGVANAAPSVRRTAEVAPSMGDAQTLGTKYSLTVINNSSNIFDFCVYQQDPNLGVQDAKSLAWFSQKATPGTTLEFVWTIDYCFVWSATGVLKKGVTFTASQTWDADPSVNFPTDPETMKAGNQVGFEYKGDNAYTFTSTPVKGAEAGTLYISETTNIPLRQASIGIGMSGAGTFVVQSQPILTRGFTPHPSYHLVAGSYEPGQVLDISAITDSLDIPYSSTFARTAILNLDNSWTLI